LPQCEQVHLLGRRVAGEDEENGLLSCGDGGARPPVLEPAGFGDVDDVELVFARDEDWLLRGFELRLESFFFRLINVDRFPRGFVAPRPHNADSNGARLVAQFSNLQQGSAKGVVACHGCTRLLHVRDMLCVRA
jgi:hypothetical protein